MGIYALTQLLESDPVYGDLADLMRRKNAYGQTQLIDEAVPFLVAKLWQDLKVPILVICPSSEHSLRLQERISAWTEGYGSPLRFNESETLPFERLVTDDENNRQRISVLSSLTDEKIEYPLILASATAICQATLDRDIFTKGKLFLEIGDEIYLDEIINHWVQTGYTTVSNVKTPGEVARRGGIVDIYPVGSQEPYRIELWGDQIDSIRTFDPTTQESVGQVERIQIHPAKETLPSLGKSSDLDRILSKIDLSNCKPEEINRFNDEIDQLLEGQEIDNVSLYSGFFNHGNFLDYFDEDGIIIEYRPNDISSSCLDLEERINQLRKTKEDRGELPYNFPSNHTKWSEMEQRVSSWNRHMTIVPWGYEDLVIQDMFVMPFSSPPTYDGDTDKFAEDIEDFRKLGGRIIASTSHTERLGEILSEKELHVSILENLSELPKEDSTTLVKVGSENIGQGFTLNLPGHRMWVTGDTELFGFTKQRRRSRRQTNSREAFFDEISPGDYVVHVEHGIARFLGTGTRPSESKNVEMESQEYLILEYSKGDRLYIPLDHLDRVSAYVAPMERAPSLTRLGTQEWNKTKSRVEKSTKEMASELLSLYAKRELAEGHSMGPDTKWQRDLENSFPYEETPDQIETLTEVKSDQESSRPMDRLVCGDVGYGKTEIALRAAFKTVMEGKQVAILVPTTILAQQHFETFASRLNAYPIEIDVLSRFRSQSEQKNIVTKVNNGTIDICIGTHRLVQKDIRFNDLGLIIVDEEQRFGVSHKERLKQMRSHVDVLTLTATPIPRTLHMSLAGVRDMSTIETAPEERLPIKTYVSEFSDDLIREAILREIDRGGQAYFLHNRVHNIEYISEYIRQLVPDARIAIAHGQMSEIELQKAMIAFTEGEIDVLVCTTIIESGLDIPNANTLIVNRADNFGLAQLYQLRGRIGRGAKQAYSYLLIPRDTSLTESAERRLKAMLSATELGSGFKIAMKDLEIRGAGNILGAEQSGNIHAVGFDLYTRLLSSAVEELRAQEIARETGEEVIEPNKDLSVVVELRIPSSIPQEYVEDLSSRLELYQRLIKTTTILEVTDIETELNDRFGPVPWQTMNLLYIRKLKLMAEKCNLESIIRNSDKITLQFPYEINSFSKVLSNILGTRWVIGNKQIRATVGGLEDDWEEELMKAVSELADFHLEMMSKFADMAI